jgi:hypothetical protein
MFTSFIPDATSQYIDMDISRLNWIKLDYLCSDIQCNQSFVQAERVILSALNVQASTFPLQTTPD